MRTKEELAQIDDLATCIIMTAEMNASVRGMSPDILLNAFSTALIEFTAAALREEQALEWAEEVARELVANVKKVQKHMAAHEASAEIGEAQGEA